MGRSGGFQHRLARPLRTEARELSHACASESTEAAPAPPPPRRRTMGNTATEIGSGNLTLTWRQQDARIRMFDCGFSGHVDHAPRRSGGIGGDFPIGCPAQSGPARAIFGRSIPPQHLVDPYGTMNQHSIIVTPTWAMITVGVILIFIPSCTCGTKQSRRILRRPSACATLLLVYRYKD